MVFIIRLRTRQGVKRLLFKDEQATWGDLQTQIDDLVGLQPKFQLISKTPIDKPEYIKNPSDKQTLASLGLKQGDMLYLGGEPRAEDKAAPKAPAFQLTPNCKHNEKGRCIFCDHAEAGAKIVGKCAHGPGATCIHCSKAVQDAKSEPAVWLCNHPDTVFCPKCIPPEHKDPDKPKKKTCSCDNSKGQHCIKCLESGPTIKVDLIPFKRYLDDLKGLCKYKHGPSVTCASCAPPPVPSYLGKTNCNKGHQPWPHGVCLSCAPPVPHLRLQRYRHCDTLQMQSRLVQNFYRKYFSGGIETPRAAFIIGYFMEEPAETKNAGAIRGVMEAMYEPPQTNDGGFTKFTSDASEEMVHELARALDLEVIGWAIARLPRSGEKYGGKVFLSGKEIKRAARFQNRYRNQETGYSRFVTLVIEHDVQVEPKAYMVSDQAVALERDGLLEVGSDPLMLRPREAKKGELIAQLVYKEKRLGPAEDFLPDELIVKVIASAPPDEKKQPTIFRHADFPSAGTDADMRNYLRKFSAEAYHNKLSDFNLLVYLGKTFGMQLTTKVCEALKSRKELSKELIAELDRLFMDKKLF